MHIFTCFTWSACLPRIHGFYRYDIHIYIFTRCVLCYMFHCTHILHRICAVNMFMWYTCFACTQYMSFTWHFCFLHVLCGIILSLLRKKGQIAGLLLGNRQCFFAVLGFWAALTSFRKYRPLGALFSGINHKEEGVT